MDKFGVVVDEKHTKEASGGEKTTCPRCAVPLVPRTHTNVLQCPNCGTEPFEEANGAR